MTGKAIAGISAGSTVAIATSVTLAVTLNKSNTEETNAYTGPKRFIDYYPQLAISDNKNDWNLINTGPCFQHFLKGVTLSDQASETTTEKITVLNDSTLGKACLFINWKKTTSSDNYWYGIIKWEWLIKKGNEILVVHSAARNGDTEKTLKLASVGRVYTSTDGNTWSLKHIKTTDKNIDKDKFPEEFADYDSSTKNYVDPNKSWKFDPDYEKACGWKTTGKSECNFEFGDPKYTLVNEVGYLWDEKEEKGAGSFFGWSFNFDTWWNENLGTQFTIDAKTKAKTGNWSKIKPQPPKQD